MKLRQLLAAALLVPNASAAEIWTVGPPSTGSDFVSIQPAIVAAAPGDLIVVRRYPDPAHRYAGFSIVGKSISLCAVAGPRVRTGSSSVQGLLLGETVALHGFEFEGSGGALDVADCDGAVRVEDCLLLGKADQPGLRATSALDLSLHGCELIGSAPSPSLGMDLSRVGAYSTVLRGGRGASRFDYSGWVEAEDGSPGVTLGARSFLWLGDCTVMGGDGGDAGCNFSASNCSGFIPGDGGPALVTDPSSRTMRVGGALEGGMGGYGDFGEQGSAGVEEVGTSQLIPGDQRLLLAPRSVRSGESCSLTVTGIPGETVGLFVAYDGWHRLLGWQWGIWFQRTLVGSSPLALGSIPASGVLEAEVTLPALAGGGSATYALQAVARTSPTRFRTTPVRIVHVVEPLGPVLEHGIVHVDASAPAGGNGRSWATAYSSLAQALASPPADPDGASEIWLAEGRYTPAGPGGNPNAQFVLRPGRHLYGGFQGHETAREERVRGQHETILDGDLNGDDTPFDFGASAGRADNSHRVVAVMTEVPLGSPIPPIGIDRLTIRGADGTGVHAAGVTVSGYGIVRLVDCDLRENRTTWQGAAIHSESYQTGATLEMSRCRVRFNHAGGWAGGLRWHGRTALVENCLFTGNTSGVAFAAMALERSAYGQPLVRIRSTTIAGNTGASCPVHIGGFGQGSAEMVNCIIWGNETFSTGTCPSGIPCELIRYNTLQVPNALCAPGTNLASDPMFVDMLGPDGISGTDDDDLRLRPGSPCIDAGDSTALDGSEPLDLAGGFRFVDDPSTPNTGLGGTRVVDHGALEYQ